MLVTYYDPLENSVTIGNHKLLGVVSIKVKRNNPLFKTVEGISPIYSTRILQNRKPFTLSVELLQTSTSNEVLKDIYNASETNLNSFIDIVVSSDRGVHISSSGYITDSPDLELEETLNNRTWTFSVNAYSVGGILDVII